MTTTPARDAAVRRPTTRVNVRAIDGERIVERPDTVVTEEPLEVRVHGPGQEPAAFAVTMRTPGNDFELAVGLLYTEAVFEDSADVERVAYCLAGTGTQEFNVVTVALRRRVDLEQHARRLAANASCGLCGKVTLDQLEHDCAPVASGPIVDHRMLRELPARLRSAQGVFDVTGGLHAAARFDHAGALIALREDVGRHNALDKVIGNAVIERQVPLDDSVLLVSGRVSFEIVQKAARAGFPLVCAVSAPSSLAVDAARRLGLTLVGFLRDERANVYTHPERVELGRETR